MHGQGKDDVLATPADPDAAVVTPYLSAKLSGRFSTKQLSAKRLPPSTTRGVRGAWSELLCICLLSATALGSHSTCVRACVVSTDFLCWPAAQHQPFLVLACSTASAFPCAALQTLSSGASRALVLAATSTSEHVESSEASLEYVVF